MPSAKKDAEKKQKHKKNDQSSSSSSNKDIVVPPSDNEQDGQVKKSASKQGFSILNSLAKFMSREKSESTTAVAAPPQPEKVEEVETISLKPEFTEAFTQTTELSVRRSSTLAAISKAVEALKEVRRRVALHVKNKTNGDSDKLQPEATQTSDSLLPSEGDFRKHDAHLSVHAKTLHEDNENKSQGHHSNNISTEPSGLHQEGRNFQQAPPHSQSHISFRGDADHYEINITHVPSEASYNGKIDVETTPFSNDANNVDGGSKVLFRSTPKSGKGSSKEEKLPPTITFKNATFQTEPEMTIRGTQTSSPRVHDDSQVSRTDHAESEHSLVRRVLQNREKCPKCDLFELMFLHGGERVLNDEEMLGMFKRHMDTHLLKAQEDLNKLYKWPRRVTEIAAISEEEADQRKISADREQAAKETAIRTSINSRNNFDENKYREDELTSNIHRKSEIGTPPRKQVNADDDESREDIEKNLNSDNFLETKGAKRDTSRHRYSHNHSSSFERILHDYLASKKRDCSEEVIIRRKNCRNHNDERNGQDSLNGYDDGYYYSENIDSRRRKLQPRYDREIEKESSSHRYGRCFCERFKFVPVTNLINSGCGNSEDYDECNYKCVSTSTNFSSTCTHPRKMEDSSEMESQLKWFIKGMLAALKGHHDVKSTERQEKVESSPREKQLELDDATTTDEENLKARQGKARNREGSVLSNIAFFMVKENAKTNSNDDQKGEEGEEPNSSAGKPDMKNKINSEPDTQTQDNVFASSPGANKSELNSGADDGKNGGNGLENVSEPKLQELVQDILSAFCTKLPAAQEGNSRRNGCETPAADLNSYCETNQRDEIVQQVCNILKPKNVPARVSTTQETSYNSAAGKGYKDGGEQQERTVCSYFYPLCDDNDSNTYWNRFSCYRSLNQAESCCDNGRKSSDCNCSFLPLQEAFKRYHTVCYRRVKMRQTCLSNCKRERESQKPRRQSLVKATSKCSRPFTATKARCTENGFCGCNINPARDQDLSEGFTYVVPQNQMYWKCL